MMHFQQMKWICRSFDSVRRSIQLMKQHHLFPKHLNIRLEVDNDWTSHTDFGARIQQLLAIAELQRPLGNQPNTSLIPPQL